MELLQPILSLFAVVGVLALLGMIWKRRQGKAWFCAPRKRRMELLDRVALTHQHSVHLLSVEGRWMAIAVTPKGIELLESGALVTTEANLCDAAESNVSSKNSVPSGVSFDLELAARRVGR